MDMSKNKIMSEGKTQDFRCKIKAYYTLPDTVIHPLQKDMIEGNILYKIIGYVCVDATSITVEPIDGIPLEPEMYFPVVITKCDCSCFNAQNLILDKKTGEIKKGNYAGTKKFSIIKPLLMEGTFVKPSSEFCIYKTFEENDIMSVRYKEIYGDCLYIPFATNVIDEKILLFDNTNMRQTKFMSEISMENYSTAGVIL